MKSYRYVLLDWDGNLAKTLDVWLEALRLPLEQRGHFLDDVEIGANFAAFQERAPHLGIHDTDAIVAEASTLATQNTPRAELYPDALEVLGLLRRLDKRLALVTTSTHQQIDGLLKKYDLAEFFDAVVCGDDIKNHKPHPEPLEKALELLGGSRSQAIMIGDSGKDIKAAHNAGIDSILFYPPTHKKFYKLAALKELDPTYIVENFPDIIKIIQAQ